MSRAVLVIAPLLGLAACKSDGNLFDQVQTDTFAQAPNNQVDILWVVDNSNSMEEEQTTLTSGFDAFAAQLDASDTDFQLGVITTSFDYADEQRGVLVGEPPFLTRDDDYVQEFAARATVGVGGSGKEKGLEAAVWAVQPLMTFEGLGGPNEGFVRTDAQLLVVVVSDEEDCSDRGALEGQPDTACYSDRASLPPVTSFVKELRALKDDDSMVQVGAIVGTEGSADCDEEPIVGSRYISTANFTGGLVGDICQSDWTQMLEDLGLNATGIYRQFQLRFAAKPETIEIWVDEVVVAQDPANGWTYDESTWFVTFNGAGIPPRGAQITVQYTIQPGVNEPPAESGETTDGT
jgi:hypothetical protein